MVELKRAHDELFRRAADECFETFDDLYDHCCTERDASRDCWQLPQKLEPHVTGNSIQLTVEGEGDVGLNDWSFSQLCRLSGVRKETLNRLSPDTASKVVQETLPRSQKPVQVLSTGSTARSLHGVSYTRLWNADLLDVVKETAVDFRPPQKSFSGGTGLYCGEQDMFAFLIDPLGWCELEGEAFAPGFFIWNSEVGRRSLGIQTFWFQKVCANHIVWDAVEVVEFTRKHTARVHDSLDEIRRIIDELARKRDQRRDGFVNTLRNAMSTKLGDCSEDVAKQLTERRIPRHLIDTALEMAAVQGSFTIFSIVDALTRLSQNVRYAGDRAELDSRIGSLLGLAV
ncbi:DUF932 domain-containing protein [Fuerstiella marisgermanici]|uniref:DUF932 domain-containing protein n=1 Tax=Fuerstiella marisgermanici TaxID=1891926 RepID=A0A1P8WGQ5_9PLAN|nr:DUF932 domain-containing protein [Fuerstiella marisgermanici]APZ93220.1 hypothetical protein Fuma_02837 [Fuerstiella marisgermanici]APZ96419.1 hypothetical protein Fuma_06088 [Fuerstiella marisgermanici]